MGKIQCERQENLLTVHFSDYEGEHQLKDFYKLFKKASGHTVQEYMEEDGKITAQTDNTKDSAGFGWDEDSGCFVSAQAQDARELVRLVWSMLSWRYSEYRSYSHMLEGIAEAVADAIPADPEDEEEILADITELLGLIG